MFKFLRRIAHRRSSASWLPARSQSALPWFRSGESTFAALAAGRALVVATLAIVAGSTGSRGAAAGFSPGDLAQRINPSPACTQSAVTSLCFCGYTPCGYWLRMYVPAVFVETVVRPGDTLLDAPSFGALIDKTVSLGTGSSSLSTTDNAAEAHAWTLSDQMLLMSSLPPCMICKPSDARVPAMSASTSSLSSGCDPSGAIASELLSVAAKIDIPYMPTLAYASEMDAVNWHTGCRDLSLANVLASNGFTCTAAGIAQWLGADSALSRLIGADACVGLWGPLYPRQMRDIGGNPVLHSAKTSYRALSVARDQLGLLPIPVDLGGRLQQAFPAISACFGIGQLPLPEPGWSPQPTLASTDGRYGWFYWRQVACCVRFDDYASCLQGGR